MTIPFVPPDMITGMICQWYGTVATIPPGFALCDGNNGTPDLRDRFVISAKQDDGGVAKATIEGALAQSGGSAQHAHTVNVGVDIALPGVPAFDDTVDAQYHYPPCYALAYIMKL